MTESLTTAARTVGLVAMLGAGVGLAAGCSQDNGATTAQGGGAVAGSAASSPDVASTLPPVSPSPAAASSSPAAPSSRPTSARPSDSEKVREQILAARE